MESKSILIVEDESIIALRIKEELEGLGYKILGPCCTGEAALGLLKTCQPGLILMDIHLGGAKDGIRVAQEITATYAIPLVFLTAHAEGETVARAKEARPYGYIIKPFTSDDLRVGVEIAFHKFKLDQEKDALSKKLLDALNEIKKLSGLLPICAWCKKIRDERGAWHQLETYITEHSEAHFSHGACPTCKAMLKEP